jgi:hypothetical protein
MVRHALSLRHMRERRFVIKLSLGGEPWTAGARTTGELDQPLALPRRQLPEHAIQHDGAGTAAAGFDVGHA